MNYFNNFPSFFLKRNFLSYILYPISFLYGKFIKLYKYWHKKQQIKITPKVICIGNIVLGGSGKTPVAIAIVENLTQHGYKCCFLSRGYGRIDKKKSFFIKQNDNINSLLVGDEVILLSKFADVLVVNKRSDIFNFPIINSYDYIILDDGMQDESLSKTAVFCIFDVERFIGNGFVIPAGPLRENLSIIKNLNAIILTNCGDINLTHIRYNFLSRYLDKSKIYYTKTVVVSEHDKSKSYIAFSGIGNNEKFYITLIENGFQILKFYTFSDHHVYSQKEIHAIVKFAKETNSSIITTEKDYVKIDKEFLIVIECLKIKIQIENIDKLLKI